MQMVRLESKKIQAIHNLAEYIDISINENKEGQVQIYTSGEKEITKDQFQHQALPNVDWIINDQEFNPIFLKQKR